MATIAELLLEQGRQQAQQRQRQGELSNQTWQNLANIAAQYGQNVRRDQMEAPIRAQEAQMRGLQIQNAQGEIADRQAASAHDAAFRDAIVRGVPDEDLVKVDPERASKFIAGRDALTARDRKEWNDTQGILRDVTLGLEAVPDDLKPEAYRQKRSELVSNKIIKPESAPENFDPNWFKATLAHAKSLNPPKTREIKTRNADGTETTQIVEDKPGALFTSQPEVKKYPVKVMGPNGQPIERLVTAAELEKGVPAYKDAPAPSTDVVQIMGPNGVPIWVLKKDAVGQPAAQAPRAVTGQERQTLAFYNRAKDSVDTITAPKEGGKSLEQQIAEAGLLSQGRLQMAPNFLQSAENQSYRQAQRAFTEARLRKESGAAIPNSEYENDAKTYFAQPGDGPAIVEQKRAARQTVLEGLKFSTGKAYEEYYGEPNVSPARGVGAAPAAGRTETWVRDASGKLVKSNGR